MSPRYSMKRGDNLEVSFYLAFRANGEVRLTRATPSLDRDERSMAVTCTLPLALFKTPTLKGTIVVPDVPTAMREFNVQVASEALAEALGVDVDFVVSS